mmetsp:Transcript_34495/g.60629  ORF Transcript_34495/g.60629 Transcript_34495/m.60629 type:complete len:129 (-) Transcript_34495:517-903(-)
MPTSQVVISFLANRCKNLGFVPLISEAYPGLEAPKEGGLYVKLFGRWDSQINSVHAQWGWVNAADWDAVSLGEDNLKCSATDKYLLLQSLLAPAVAPHSKLFEFASEAQSVGDLLRACESMGKKSDST